MKRQAIRKSSAPKAAPRSASVRPGFQRGSADQSGTHSLSIDRGRRGFSPTKVKRLKEALERGDLELDAELIAERIVDGGMDPKGNPP